MPKLRPKPPCPKCGEKLGLVIYFPPGEERATMTCYWCPSCQISLKRSEIDAPATD